MQEMYEEGNTPYDWLVACVEVTRLQGDMIDQLIQEHHKMARLQRDIVMQQQRLLQETVKLRQQIAAQDLRIRQLEARL